MLAILGSPSYVQCSGTAVPIACSTVPARIVHKPRRAARLCAVKLASSARSRSNLIAAMAAAVRSSMPTALAAMPTPTAVNKRPTSTNTVATVYAVDMSRSSPDIARDIALGLRAGLDRQTIRGFYRRARAKIKTRSKTGGEHGRVAATEQRHQGAGVRPAGLHVLLPGLSR